MPRYFIGRKPLEREQRRARGSNRQKLGSFRLNETEGSIPMDNVLAQEVDWAQGIPGRPDLDRCTSLPVTVSGRGSTRID